MRNSKGQVHPAKILVIKLRAIGDVIMATPFPVNLRHNFPEAEIHFLTETAAVPILRYHPDVDRIIELPRGKWEKMPAIAAWREAAGFIRRLRESSYDWVFDLFGNPRSAFLTFASGAPRRIGFRFRGRSWAYTDKIRPRGDQVHEVDFNLDALSALSLPVKDRRLLVRFGSEETSYIDGWINNQKLNRSSLVALHVWGGWPAKRWPLERFAALGDILSREKGQTVVVVWGPGEKEAAQRVRDLMQEKSFLAPPTTLLELAALLSRCRLLVANDSGPMHVSAAVGTPTVGIYGPTNSRLQGPFGPVSNVVSHDSLECLGCNRLDCDHNTCMTDLTVEKVLDTAVSLIEESGKTE